MFFLAVFLFSPPGLVFINILTNCVIIFMRPLPPPLKSLPGNPFFFVFIIFRQNARRRFNKLLLYNLLLSCKTPFLIRRRPILSRRPPSNIPPPRPNILSNIQIVLNVWNIINWIRKNIININNRHLSPFVAALLFIFVLLFLFIYIYIISADMRGSAYIY